MSVFHENMLIGSSGQGAPAAAGISRSLRFNSSDSAYLSRTPASAGNRRTFTWSGWVKLGTNFGSRRMLFGGGTIANSIPNTYLEITDSAQLGLDSVDPPSFATAARVRTTAVLRDPSAWYHIVFSVDTTQATTANRIKIYINGVEQTSYSSTTYPSQNYDTGINSTQIQTIGAYPEAAYRSSLYLDGYLADIHFIDGQALTPSSFTEVSATTGQLIPKAYTGTFGTNGFWLKFSDNSAATATTLGKDYSGNSNNWTPNNLSVTAGAGNDSLVDTPTSYGTDTGAGGEVRGNYCTWNPLQTASTHTLTNGNLDVTSTSAGFGHTRGTVAVSSGKWYWEITVNTGSNADSIGIISTEQSSITNYPGSYSNGYDYYSNGQKQNNSSGSNYGASYTTGDIIGVALDLTAGTLVFYKNGSSQGTAFSSLSGIFAPAVGDGSSNGAINMTANFGQRAFAYTAPSGFKALCDTNLTAPVIAKPNTVMDVKLYTGNGSTQTISGLNFSPDLVWVKQRDSTNTASHVLVDIVRGNNNVLRTNGTDAENAGGIDPALYDGITNLSTSSFDVVKGSSGVYNGTNGSSKTYVAWAWDAGTSTVANNAGSITSQVRANASAGFSVVTYTGSGSNSTVGHGLGVTPSLVIVKKRSASEPWLVWFNGFTSNEYLYLSSTDAKGSYSGTWGSTPTSTVFGVYDQSNNANGATFVSYCWAPVAGYSSFGSYTGNGSADGPFVYTGFRPRWVMLKRTDAVSDWWIYDTARDTYNVMGSILYPNLSAAEYVDTTIFGRDLLSNGFKVRTSNATVNGNGATYIYAAFAESPFNYSRAR